MDKYAELEKLAQLKEKWVLSDEEFNIEKKKLLESETQSRQENKDNVIWINTKFINHPYYYDYHNDSYLSMLFSHKWRINRGQLIWYILLSFLLWFICLAIIIAVVTFLGINGPDTSPDDFFTIITLPLAYSITILFIKRFHDIDKSGWWQLVPVYNYIATLFFSWDNSDNRFWPPPK